MDHKNSQSFDDDARSYSGESEDDALFQGVTSSVARGSAEAATFAHAAAKDRSREAVADDPKGFGMDEKEFDFEASASASITSVPFEQIGVTRDGKATEFHFPAKTAYRGLSSSAMGPTLVESRSQFKGFGGSVDGPRGPLSLASPDQVKSSDPGKSDLESSIDSLWKKGIEISSNVVIPMLGPYYRLETHTHARLPHSAPRSPSSSVDDALVEAMATVSLALQRQGVDFEFKPTKCKWKCAYSSAVGSTVCLFFVVRFWRRESGDTVVEFQRRHGDTAAFLKIYRGTIQGLGLGSPVASRPRPAAGFPAPPSMTSSASARPAGLEPPSALDLDLGIAVPSLIPKGSFGAGPVGLSDDDVSAFVVPLKEMLDSRLLDSTLEATRALARLSACKDNRVPLYQAGIIATLDGFVREESVNAESLGLLHQAATIFAVTCLANLSEEPMVQTELCRTCGDVLLDQVRNGAYSDRAMRREAARTLRNLCCDDMGADEFIKTVGKNRLQAWCQNTLPDLSDESMRNDAAFVTECLQKRWVACS